MAATRQAITNGSNDNVGLEANTVVALENAATPGKVACSGTLITPLVVLTARSCVTPERAGARPNVRVGADAAASTVFASGSDAVTMDSADLALVFLDPQRPVLEEARSGRQKLMQPNAEPPTWDLPETASDYRDLGVAGWSPLDGSGQPRRTTANFRQQFSREVMRVFTGTTGPNWVRDVSAQDGALMEGDLGGPLFQTDKKGIRQVVGVATKMGVNPAAAPGCPPTAQRCDVWEDVTTESAQTWIASKARVPADARTQTWYASHSNGDLTRRDGTRDVPDWWLGEADYTGECRVDVDADCDHWLDFQPDAQGKPTNVPRDNCLGWWNPDQADKDDDGVGDVCDHCASVKDDQKTTITAWTNRTPGSDLGPAKRYPTATETMEAKFPGNACRTVAQIDIAVQDTYEVDPQNPRTMRNAAGLTRPKANNLLTTKASISRGGPHVGYFVAASCACDRATDAECTEDNTDAAAPCRPSELVSSTLSAWKAAHLADAAKPAPDRVEASDALGNVPTSFPDVSAGAAEVRTWSWRYWRDAHQLAPVAYSDQENVPRSVFKGVVAAWAKSYAPAAGPRPSVNDVTDAENAAERVSLTRVNLGEVINKPPSQPLDSSLFQLADTPKVVIPRDLGCPQCGPGAIRIQERWDRFVNHEAVQAHIPAVQASPFLDAHVVRAASLSGIQAVVADDRAGSFLPGTSHAALFNLRTARVANVLTTGELGPMILRSVSAPAAPSASPPPAPPSPVGEQDANVAFLGPNLVLPNDTDPPHVLVMSSKRNAVFDFGTTWTGPTAQTIKYIDLETQAETRIAPRGAPLGNVVAATYRTTDDFPYVLDMVTDAADQTSLRLVQLNLRWTAKVVATWPLSSPALYAMTSNPEGQIVLSVYRKGAFHIVVAEIANSASPNTSATIKALYTGTRTLATPARVRDGVLTFAVLDGAGTPTPVSLPLGTDGPGMGVSSIDVSRVGEAF